MLGWWFGGNNAEQAGGAAAVPQNVAAVIVGGGIIGCAVAMEIAANQVALNGVGAADVVLLEKHSVGSGASGLSGGTFWNGGWGRYNKDGSNLLSAEVTAYLW
jgi:glycine/D-amino acid oxidase-like deaminating enzyme